MTAGDAINNEEKPRRPLTRVAGCSWNARPDARGTDGRMTWNAHENRVLRQANEILKKASAYFAQAELDRPFRK